MTGGRPERRALPCQLDMHRRCSGKHAPGRATGAGRLWLDCWCSCHFRTDDEMRQETERLRSVRVA